MGANNPPMGLAFNRRGNQEVGVGDVRGAVLNTTEQGAGGGGRGDQTTDLPFCSTSISGIGKESKKECKRERKVIMRHQAVTKRRISRRIRPWDEPPCCTKKKENLGGRKKVLITHWPPVLGYKNSYDCELAKCHTFHCIHLFIPTRIKYQPKCI